MIKWKILLVETFSLVYPRKGMSHFILLILCQYSVSNVSNVSFIMCWFKARLSKRGLNHIYSVSKWTFLKHHTVAGPKQVKELYLQRTRAKHRAVTRGETSSHRSTSRFSVLLPTLSKLMPSIPTQPPAEKIDFNYLPKWQQIPRVGNPCWSNLYNQNNSLGLTNETSTLTKRAEKVPFLKKEYTPGRV